MNFNSQRCVEGYHFPLNGDIYGTLNPAFYKLQLIIFSEAVTHTASIYFKCLSEVCGLYFQ